MKTTKTFIFLALMTLFVSCGEKQIDTDDSEAVVTVDNQDINSIKPFANPTIIYGSSFGNFFQMLYKQGNFADMLKFTSSGSISKFGKENILKMYQNMAFAYDMKLKSMSGKDTITLNYEAGIYATKHMIRMPVTVENDTTKIILQDLEGLR